MTTDHVMRRVDRLFEEYGRSHQNPINKRIHRVCVPLIFFATAGLLWAIPFPGNGPTLLNWATIGLAVTLAYYASLSLALTIGMTAFVAACLGLASFLDGLGDNVLWISSAILFALAWIGQFVGHHIEGRRPSFVEDLQFLLIGPAWVLNDLYRQLGLGTSRSAR